MRLGQTLEGTLCGVKGVASPFAFTALLLGILIQPNQFLPIPCEQSPQPRPQWFGEQPACEAMAIINIWLLVIAPIAISSMVSTTWPD